MEEVPPPVELGLGVSVGWVGLEVEVVVACWDSSSMIQVLDGGSMVGRPMREWRTEAMRWSVKRRMQLKKSSRFCGGGTVGGVDLSLLSLEVEAMAGGAC